MSVGGTVARGLLVVLLLATLGLLVPALAAGPPLPISLSTTAPITAEQKYQIKRVGRLEVAPIYFEGLRLFDVAAPASRDPHVFPPVAARIEVIQDNLRDVVPPATSITDLFRPPQTRYDPETFVVKIGSHSGYVTLTAADGSGAKETPLVTLTEADAKYNGISEHELARSWADTLQSTLGEALRQRQPGAFGRQLGSAALIFAAAVLLTVLLFGLLLIARRQRSSLDQLLAPAEEAGEAENQPTGGERSRLRVLRGALVVADWALGWSIVVAWALAVLLIMYVFPTSQSFARKLGSQALTIFVIWFLAGVLNRVGGVVVRRSARAWEERPFLSLDEAGRRQLRLPTIERAIQYAKSMAVYLTASALTLGTLGASASAVVTLGAALAFAVSFGAQSLVKDFVNGFFILIEDQYAIGDYVTIGTSSGYIEAVTLRITQLRSDDGRLVTIPNSQVAVVENWTRTWSRVDYRVTVAFDSDVQRATSAFDGVLSELARDPHWGKLITQPPKTLGVEAMSSAGIVLRGWVQTVPGKMFEVSRELNRRMHAALAREGVTIGMPVSRVFRSELEVKPEDGTSVPPSTSAE